MIFGRWNRVQGKAEMEKTSCMGWLSLKKTHGQPKPLLHNKDLMWLKNLSKQSHQISHPCKISGISNFMIFVTLIHVHGCILYSWNHPCRLHSVSHPFWSNLPPAFAKMDQPNQTPPAWLWCYTPSTSPSRFWATLQNAGSNVPERGEEKKTWVLVCFPHFQVTSNLSPHREPQVVVKHLQKERASGGLLSSNFYWIACIILKIPSNPGQISSGVGDPNDYSIYMLCKYHSLSEHTQLFHPRLFPFFRIFPTFPRPVQLQHPTKAMPRYFFRCGVEALLSPD